MSKHYCPLCMGKFDAKSSCIKLHGRVIEDERSVTVCPYCGCKNCDCHTKFGPLKWRAQKAWEEGNVWYASTSKK